MIIRLLKSIVDLHIWIALSASALCAVSYYEFNLNPDWAILLFAFGSCLGAYNFLNIQSGLQVDQKFKLTAPVIMMFTGFVLSLLACYYADKRLILLAAIPSIIVCIYILPVIPGPKEHLNSTKKLIPGRNSAWFKISLIALAWTASTYATPILLAKPSPELNQFISGFFQRFFYIFGITIPFDVRDMSVDPAEMRTVAQRFGLNYSIILSVLVLLTSAAFAIYSYFSGFLSDDLLCIHLITLLISSILILNIRGKSKYYYTFLIDGTMMLPVMLHLIYILLKI